MSDELWSALISLLGSAFGAVVGIAVNTRLSNYRIGQLERKVDKHNNLIERMFRAEGNIRLLDEKISEMAARAETRDGCQ